MSTHGSPYTSGPPPGRGPGPSPGAGATSLWRASDRFERWFRRVLIVVLLLGLPAAAVGAGLKAYEASIPIPSGPHRSVPE
ncbi:hypothetical protein [Streptomyces sp. NPDC001388]|uniref:hypothetical protein n=1 Tax=Streptomyces sp. NPDC001388 TaxID=3364568 RepID=UPI00367D3EF1